MRFSNFARAVRFNPSGLFLVRALRGSVVAYAKPVGFYRLPKKCQDNSLTSTGAVAEL